MRTMAFCHCPLIKANSPVNIANSRCRSGLDIGVTLGLQNGELRYPGRYDICL